MTLGTRGDSHLPQEDQAALTIMLQTVVMMAVTATMIMQTLTMVVIYPRRIMVLGLTTM